MKNKIKLGIITIMCTLALACGETKPSGKVLFESPDKKVKVYESEVIRTIKLKQTTFFSKLLRDNFHRSVTAYDFLE